MWCLWCYLTLPASIDAVVVVVLGLPLLVELASSAEVEALEVEIVVEVNIVLFVYLPVSVHVSLVEVGITVEVGVIVAVRLNTDEKNSTWSGYHDILMERHFHMPWSSLNLYQ